MTNTPDLLTVVLDRWQSTHDQYADAREELESLLVAREDAIADYLRLAGVQFGLFPQIVAKVLADAGLGSVPTEEAKALINAQYVALMEQLAEAQRRGDAGV